MRNNSLDEINRHKKLVFPLFPEDDEFADWLSDLVEVDAYLIGIVSSLQGKSNLSSNICKNIYSTYNDILKRFKELDKNKLSKYDKSVYNKTNLYLDSLYNVIRSICPQVE